MHTTRPMKGMDHARDADLTWLWVCAGVVMAGVAYETAKSVPDLRRYLRMRRM
ncbi:hypothetical protein OIE62_01940 [Streptomyces scopuliridis]|uniref:Uncharacterized protein n=1 Tax=Streptomyces scopuliridis TaxID=452529 RepID=A0ACD4ZW88_9ACTN|nr:hypothetical protein [Streptomyces scopuliridis]WSB38120.1 hypothetical protein OG949_38400 [Streptomyces scopuliridis]WSC02553.1 hypothetical protein OG835_39895 [Streptomyces scopuliridis]WSC03915.1 hypothetical protein OIE62_01940 [Streptomyces scopuliridis]